MCKWVAVQQPFALFKIHCLLSKQFAYKPISYCSRCWGFVDEVSILQTVGNVDDDGLRASVHGTHLDSGTYIYIYICVCVVRVCACVYTYIYTHVFTYIYIYMYTHTHIYIYICICVCCLSIRTRI